jgi:hypothetical protein
MPLNLFHRERAPKMVSTPAESPAVPENLVSFDGLTDRERLVGMVTIGKGDRLSDALNRRDVLPVRNVMRRPLDSAGSFSAEPETTSIDPYGFVLVFAGADSRPDYSREEFAARRIRKVSYRVELELGALRVRGTIWLYQGVKPAQLTAERIQNAFLPVTEAEVWSDGRRIEPHGTDAVLVNRYSLEKVAEL